MHLPLLFVLFFIFFLTPYPNHFISFPQYFIILFHCHLYCVLRLFRKSTGNSERLVEVVLNCTHLLNAVLIAQIILFPHQHLKQKILRVQSKAIEIQSLQKLLSTHQTYLLGRYGRYCKKVGQCRIRPTLLLPPLKMSRNSMPVAFQHKYRHRPVNQ